MHHYCLNMNRHSDIWWLFYALVLLYLLGCADPEGQDQPILLLPPSEPVVKQPMIDAYAIAMLDESELAIAFGEPFKISTCCVEEIGILVLEDRFYNLKGGAVLRVNLQFDVFNGFQVSQIEITFPEPFITYRAAIEACGVNFDELTLIKKIDRIIEYRRPGMTIIAHLNENNLWAVVVINFG